MQIKLKYHKHRKKYCKQSTTHQIHWSIFSWQYNRGRQTSYVANCYPRATCSLQSPLLWTTNLLSLTLSNEENSITNRDRI